MRPHTIRRDDVKALSPADRSMLCSIYLRRCLTFGQIYRFYYQKERAKETYARWHLHEMLDKEYLMAVDYPERGETNTAYFLSATGVVLARRLFRIPSTKLPEAPNRCAGFDWHSSDLTIAPSKINHQIHLNTFSLLFAERAGELDYNYLDEKYIPTVYAYSMRSRPDAQIVLPNQTLYLEMDMNTESMADLEKKWLRYRVLVGTGDFYEKSLEAPAAVLFILDNITRPDIRTKTVLKSLEKSGFMDCISPTFDFYIGTPEEILDLSFKYLIPHTPFDLQTRVQSVLHNKYGFQPLPPLKGNFKRYDFFGKIGSQIYAIDTYDRMRGSVLAKTYLANRDGVLVNSAAGAPVKHLVITDNLDLLMQDITLMKCQGMKNNFYAQIKDIETTSLEESIFRVDAFGHAIKEAAL